MSDLRFAMFGAGWFARFQLAAWGEVEGARCVALYNRTRSKGEALAREFGVPRVYDDPEALLDGERLDFVDIVTHPDTHGQFVRQAAARGLAVICQKPMASTLAEAEGMVEACRKAGVPYFVHENWRWQTPMRHLKRLLDEGSIGTPFRARIDMVSGYPPFDDQPYLRELEQFVLTDMGSHILDVARWLFGEAEGLSCRTDRIHTDIRGEDVATVMLRMGGRTTVVCNMGYPEHHLEHDRFLETYVFIEGTKGSVELGPDYWIRVTTESGTHSRRYPPPTYAWSAPPQDLVDSSIVDCHANILRALQGGPPAETTGEDNIKTVRLVFAAYDSAASGDTVHFSGTGGRR
ncbi:MAG: Gfo/Idh/MocA family oxidoreductase [Gemmatimonadetes bacterium]|nr:Gfo/Idh/MocA family oxidoreductase [Gemmatimonadota bacterium]